MRSYFRPRWALLALLLTTGCASQRWMAVSGPNPLSNQRSFIVEPLHFESVLIGDKTEGEYLAAKSGDSANSWLGDKLEMNRLFFEVLASQLPDFQIAPATAPPAPGTFIIRPICTFVEPGTFNGFFNRATQVNLRVQFLDAAGGVVDQVETRTVVRAGIYNPSSGGRLRSGAKDLGARVARFVRFRTGAQ